MARIGLVGPAYTSQSVNADAQTCKNWYVERDESEQGRSAWQLLPTPGLKVFCKPPLISGVVPNPAPQLIPTLIALPDGQLLTIINDWNEFLNLPRFDVYRVHADGTTTLLFTDSQSAYFTRPISYAIGATQLAYIAPDGRLFAAHWTGAFTPVPAAYSGSGDPVIGLSQVVYLDGYFLALKANSSQVIFSLDALNWDPLDIFQVSITTDYVLSMIVDHRQLILAGAVDTVVYDNTGDADNPFQPNPSGFIQQGIAATDSLIPLDNTVFFIGGDERGHGIGWRLNGYRPDRVTTFAVETAWQAYARIDDAVAYPYQDQGHAFWVIYFPTANKTWVYDVSTGAWHEREHLLPRSGILEAHRSWAHTFAFGKHLVGDWKTGTIYEMHIPVANGSGGWDFVTDFGDVIPRSRRSPHLANEGERIYVSELQVFLESGLGPIPPLSSPGDLGLLTLRPGPF